MICPKCGVANAEGLQFCTHCHATLIFKCPKCGHTQMHGATCDACGLNFDAFWKQQLAIKHVKEESRERRQLEQEVDDIRTALTVPFSGPAGWTIFLVTEAIRRIGTWFRSR
jgi:uncharacterized membrane protein YvbJ